MSLADAHGVFVTGTDTGVGKTVVSAALVLAAAEAGLSPGYLKVAQTGVATGELSDEGFVRSIAAGSGLEPATRCPYNLAEPLAPWVAAEIEGVELDPGAVLEAQAELAAECDLVVAEGAGGALVPFSKALTMADLAAMLGFPVLVVCRPALGTLNHSLLTVEALRARGLEITGIVISGMPGQPGLAESTNAQRIAGLTGVPLVASLPCVGGLAEGRVPSGSSVAELRKMALQEFAGLF